MSNKSLAKPASELCILVTGGAGYIGSHTSVELLRKGYKVVILDNLSNSQEVAIERIRQITLADTEQLAFYRGNVLDRCLLERIFRDRSIDAIIHFAGYKAVGESIEKPLEYYWNNVAGALVLCDVARSYDVKNFVFSSSAAVYGDATSVPLSENCPKGIPASPYGQTKSMLEQILTDMFISDSEWNIVFLRYFNPIGAHESGLIGEDPRGIPSNLVPYIAQVAAGRLPYVRVYGNNYPTPDGTGIRDYVHVVDLARGHSQALEWQGGKCGTGKSTDPGSIQGGSESDGTRRGVGVFNLGTGTGSSVLEVIDAYAQACGKKIPYRIEKRREGDIVESFATCEKAKRELGWTSFYDLGQMCLDSWHWQSRNPNGYGLQ